MSAQVPIKRIFYDFETTGTNVQTISITEVSMVVEACVQGSLQVVARFTTLIRLGPDVAYPEHVQNLTGISVDHCQQGMPWKQALAVMIHLAGNHAEWIAHNGLKFDHALLMRDMTLYFPERLQAVNWTFQDTLLMAKGVEAPTGHPPTNFKLSTLYNEWVPEKDRRELQAHRAEADVLMMMAVYRVLRTCSPKQEPSHDKKRKR